MSTPEEAQRYYFLEGLTAEQAGRVLAVGERRPLHAGDVLFPLGAPADHVFLVEHGSLALSMPLTVRGESKEVLLEDEERGRALGFSALVPPHRFTLTARASVDAVVVALPRSGLEVLLAAEPAIAAVVMRNLLVTVVQRLHRVQAMWMREMQRTIDMRLGDSRLGGR